MTMQLATRDVLEGLAIPFGSPTERDLQGEWFSKRTDLHLDWFPTDGRPTLYHHDLDKDVSGETIGRQVSHEVRDDGVWVEVQLAQRSKWVELIRRLLDRDGLGFSSGALPSLVETSKDTGESCPGRGSSYRPRRRRLSGCPDHGEQVPRRGGLPERLRGRRGCTRSVRAPRVHD